MMEIGITFIQITNYIMFSLTAEILVYVLVLLLIKYFLFFKKKITFFEWKNEIILSVISFFVINFSTDIIFHDFIVTFFTDSTWVLLNDIKSTIHNTWVIVFILKIISSIFLIPLVFLFLNKKLNPNSIFNKAKHYFILNLGLILFVYIVCLFIFFYTWLEVYTKPFLLK